MYEVVERTHYRKWEELSEKEKSHIRYDSSISTCLSEAARHEIDSMFEYELEKSGFPIGMERRWSLSYSQGDGCSCTGIVNISEKLFVYAVGEDAEMAKRMEWLRYSIATGDLELHCRIYSHNHHYFHEDTISICRTTVLYSGFLSNKMDNDIDDLCDEVLNYLKNICTTVKREGYKIIENVESDENIAELCEEHDILFDQYGNEHWGLLDKLRTNKETYLSWKEVV